MAIPPTTTGTYESELHSWLAWAESALRHYGRQHLVSVAKQLLRSVESTDSWSDKAKYDAVITTLHQHQYGAKHD